MRELLERVEKMLTALEWTGGGDCESCPECQIWEHNGHAPDCVLAALLADVRKELESETRASGLRSEGMSEVS